MGALCTCEPQFSFASRPCLVGGLVIAVTICDMLGCPEAVQHWNACYGLLTSVHGLASKVGLVGLSRGGLYCYNWAIANPGKVACIYGDAPVCDFKSWPGGRGKGKGSSRDWQLVLQRYGFSDDAEALAYDKNPIDCLAPRFAGTGRWSSVGHDRWEIRRQTHPAIGQLLHIFVRCPASRLTGKPHDVRI
jgi:hypothetical protein